MDIRIDSYLTASDLLEREPNRWAALVMLDSDVEATDFVEKHTTGHLNLRFDDVDRPMAGKQPATLKQVEEGLAFGRGQERLVVSCRAGQGRSAAMAYLIVAQAKGPDAGLEQLDPARHSPNRLVVSLGAQAMGKPQVLEAFDAWRKEHAGVHIADHLAEIQKRIEDLEAKGARDLITAG